MFILCRTSFLMVTALSCFSRLNLVVPLPSTTQAYQCSSVKVGTKA